jgi:phosphatidylserine/phosphatidylglycerophosphate/cardiolipin synthase-like enzyme
MRDELEALSIASASLCGKLPENAIRRLADEMLRAGTSTFPELSFVGTPLNRAIAGEFLRVRRKSFPTLTNQAVVAGLLGALVVHSKLVHHRKIEVVATGPLVEETQFRQTEQAILEVIDFAQKRLLIVAYSVFSIPQVQLALLGAAKRGVHIDFLLETPHLVEGESAFDTLKEVGSEVKSVTHLYFWPKENRLFRKGKPALMHAKCCIADRELMFLSSANFTDQAFNLNLEIGLLLRDPQTCAAIADYFDSLLRKNTFVKIPE